MPSSRWLARKTPLVRTGHTEYSFAVNVCSADVRRHLQITTRYSSLRSFHRALSNQLEVPLPPLPPKRWRGRMTEGVVESRQAAFSSILAAAFEHCHDGALNPAAWALLAGFVEAGDAAARRPGAGKQLALASARLPMAVLSTAGALAGGLLRGGRRLAGRVGRGPRWRPRWRPGRRRRRQQQQQQPTWDEQWSEQVRAWASRDRADNAGVHGWMEAQQAGEQEEEGEGEEEEEGEEAEFARLFGELDTAVWSPNAAALAPQTEEQGGDPAFGSR